MPVHWIKYILGSLFLFCYSPTITFSQSGIDSLWNVYKTIDDQEARLWALTRMAFLIEESDLDSALSLSLFTLDLAEEVDNPEIIPGIYRRIGIINRKQGLLNESHEYFKKSLNLLKDASDTVTLHQLASTYNSLANLENELKNYEYALEYYYKSLEIYNEIGDPNTIGRILLNIGTVNNSLGNYTEAFSNAFRARDIFYEHEYEEMYVHINLNIGYIYEEQENFEKAESYYLHCLSLCKPFTVNEITIDVCLHLGRLYNKMKKFHKAVGYLKQGLGMAQEIGRIISIKDISNELAESYINLDLPEMAYIYQNQYVQISEQLNEQEKKLRNSGTQIMKSYEQQTRFQTEKIRKVRRRSIFFVSSLGFMVIFVLLVIRNYRIKQKANKLLAEMDELKSRLFSNISHEFRTPLTLILGPLEQMLSKETSKNPSKKTVKMMQRNANRLLDLVNQMLDLSKVDAGSMKLDLVEGDILKLLSILLSAFSSLADKKEIRFKQSIPEGTFITWFDGDKIEKILTNLLSNAFKFTAEGGVVSCEVIVPESKDGIQIVVKDTGKGISGEQLDKIFDRFHQVEKPGDPERIGTGIGLALIKELVELLHGDISVESTVGTGTTFTLNLPLGKDHLKRSEYTLIGDVPEADFKKSDIDVDSHDHPAGDTLYDDQRSEEDFPLVLTVEDHADIRTHIYENLEDCCRMIEASDGEMGLNKAIECIPDLIITDLMMPKMDGVEMCKKLKTDERTSHIPIIMLTAKASVEDRIEGIETGADAYMTKPFNIKELRIRVNKLIEQRNKLRERFSKEIKLEPRDIAITSADERFLSRALEVIEKQISNPDFEVRNFQTEIGMSRMQLFRKLRALTNTTPSEFIRVIRLKRAAKLMEQNYGNVAQITYEVGFNNLSYFAKCFKGFFGKSPSDYMKEHSS